MLPMNALRLIRSSLVVVFAVFVGSCGNDSKSSSSPATTPVATVNSTEASATTTADPASADVQDRTLTSADGTVIDYVLLVPAGRVAGQPGKVLFTHCGSLIRTGTPPKATREKHIAMR